LWRQSCQRCCLRHVAPAQRCSNSSATVQLHVSCSVAFQNLPTFTLVNKSESKVHSGFLVLSCFLFSKILRTRQRPPSPFLSGRDDLSPHLQGTLDVSRAHTKRVQTLLAHISNSQLAAISHQYSTAAVIDHTLCNTLCTTLCPNGVTLPAHPSSQLQHAIWTYTRSLFDFR